MTRHRVRHMPVLRDGKLAGIISIGDVVKYRLDDLELETNILRDAYIAALEASGVVWVGILPLGEHAALDRILSETLSESEAASFQRASKHALRVGDVGVLAGDCLAVPVRLVNAGRCRVAW
jgi:CBS domain-containing protein